MTKLGIIGAGAFTEFCLTAYRESIPNLIFKAITDLDQSAAERLAEKFSIPTVAKSVTELLADPTIDVVLILTPPNTHFELAQAALRAGKHVLVEKPIAFSVPEATKLLELADQNQLQMTANLVLRYHPFHQQLAQMVASGELGALRQISTTALLAEYPADHWYWQPAISGGFFLNTHCHFLDLYSYIFGRYPQSVTAAGTEAIGQTIISAYDPGLATLNVNVHVTGDQEDVRTTYVFERAVVTTVGWLPATMTITQPNGEQQSQTTGEKIALYRQLLAAVMVDLIKRIADPDLQTPIDHTALLETVRVPTRAAENQLR